MFYANKYYLYCITLIIFSFKIYSQNNITDLPIGDTIYINFIDSPKAMEKTKIIIKNVFDKSITEFNHFDVFFFDEKNTEPYYFQFNNTKNKDLIKKISNHKLKQIDSKIILNYNFLNKLGYRKTMDLLKDKKIFVIHSEACLFKCAKVYEVKIINHSYLSN